MIDHASRSPSARHRWAPCPGSVREEARYPDSSSSAAIDGTHTHTLLEYCVYHGLLDPTSMVGSRLQDEEGIFQIDKDRADRVNVALNYIRERGFRDVIAEESVDPATLLGRDDCWGTVDIQGFVGDTYEIIDYKDGMGFVEVESNPQLEMYALGAIAKPEFEQYFKTIRMTIIQPKLAFKGTDAIRWVELSIEEMKAKLPQIQAEAAATDNPDAPLVPGDVQCKFCRAKGSCAALADHVSKEIGLMFNSTENLVPGIDVQAANKNPIEMSADQIRQVLEATPLVRQFIEAVESEAQRRLETGQSIPGFKLVYGRGSRKWTFSDDEMFEKLKSLGIPKGAMYITSLVSPAQAEKLIWEKRDGTRMQLSDRQLKIMDAEYITRTSGKLTMVPESDSREGVVVNAESLFASVDLPAWMSPPVAELPDWMK